MSAIEASTKSKPTFLPADSSQISKEIVRKINLGFTSKYLVKINNNPFLIFSGIRLWHVGDARRCRTYYVDKLSNE